MIPILTAEQIRAADNYTIKHEPIASIDLMERASAAFVGKFKELVSLDNCVAIVCGAGNNGGDGFAIARLLDQEGYSVSCYEVFINQRSSDCEVNRMRYLKANTVIDISNEKKIKFNEAVIVDGLFGSGLNRAITEDRIKHTINAINDSKKAVVAINIPSGLFRDRIEGVGAVIKADYTITFGSPKMSFLFPETGNLVGEFHIIDIGLDRNYVKSIDSSFF
jgi:NAD(P)H-hydrate epimerase